MKQRILQATGILLCSLLCSPALQAQNRKINLSVQLTQPTANQIFNYNDVINIAFTIKNNGPDLLKATDTLIFIHSLSQNPVGISVGSLTNNANLPSGSTSPSGLLAQANNVNNTGTDQTVSICIVALDINTSGITANNNPVHVSWDDTDTTNNRSCATVTLKKRNVSSIFDVKSGYEPLVMSPNPAHNNASFTLDLEKAGQVTLYIRDIQGRTVITKDYGKATAGSGKTFSLDLTALKNGLYFAELNVGERKLKGKLSVQH